ncbi:AHH domain-containing protein [Schlegelella sp. S2-27]|uniref:AHH domain-containing protein n=1 Tax=Caldimonas mangrovi TaxID=2944811 RepID=A0ABT0YVG4_9BURK|nr:AHH domain-containing protein [Caldimonas mangrovi]MCM5682751.1 AHH domain-containing protein [Caldimonas mangrovi]
MKIGNTAKNSVYLANMKSHTERDRDHPRFHGIRMQAHHVLSAEGVKLSGLGRKIEKCGYDINSLSNLAFIPCTLQGACHLGIQPHRGNHTAVADPENDYDDDDEPLTYHKMVSRKIQELDPHLRKECVGKDEAHLIPKKLDDMSTEVLELIQYKPTKAPLTTIAKHFAPGSPIGCGGVDNVGAVHVGHCPVGRNHLGKQGPKQKKEDIKFVSDGRYRLRTRK